MVGAKQGSGQANAAGSMFPGGSPGEGGVRAGEGAQAPRSLRVGVLKDQEA